MKPTLRVDREQLYSKLKSANKFIATKTIIPAMDSFLFTITGQAMEILATDGNIQVRLHCPVVSKEDFSVCVLAKKFTKLVGDFRENEVILTLKKENLLEIKSGKSKYNSTLDCFPKDFPVMPAPPVDSEIAMNQFMLNMGLNQSEKFVDDENPNANYTGINISEKDNKILFTGISGNASTMFRAAIKPISINKWDAVPIPVETAKKVSSLLDDKGEVGITHGGGKIVFFTSGNDAFEVTSKTADIKFPDAEVIFSKKPETSITINTLEFKDAAKRLKLFTERGAEPIIVINNLENPGELTITSSDNLTGQDGEEVMTIKNPMSLPFIKKYNADTIIKVLASIEQSEIDVFFTESDRVPAFIIPKVTNEEQDIFIFLVSSCII